MSPYLLILLLTAATAGAADVSFPLDGHYRDGRYMPVRVAADSAGATNFAITLRADGAVATEIPVNGKADVVVPWLAARGSLANARWTTTGGTEGAIGATLKPLGSDERLVAYSGDALEAAKLAAELFPGDRVVPVALDLGRPAVLSPAAAYESVDLAALDAAAAGRVTESQLATLLAGGTVVAVRSDAKPGGAWPWARRGAYWVARHEPVGPRSVVEADAYLPAYAWVRGWPAAVRGRAVLLVSAFALVALGCSLWRGRLVLPLLLALCAAATGGVAWWGTRLSPVAAAGGSVVIVVAGAGDHALTQRDAWAYRSALRPAEASAAFTDLTRPVFASAAHLRQSDVRLVTDADGRPARFAARLDRDRTIAFVTRAVSPARPVGALVQPVRSLMLPLADQLYPGRVVGQIRKDDPAGAENWDAVVVEQ